MRCERMLVAQYKLAPKKMPSTAADEAAAAVALLLARPPRVLEVQQLQVLAEQIASGDMSADEPADALLHVIEGAAR